MKRLLVMVVEQGDDSAFQRTVASLADAREEFDVVVSGASQPVSCGTHAVVDRALSDELLSEYVYLARLDAGVVVLRGRFSSQMAFLDAKADYGLVGCYGEWVDAEGKRLQLVKPPASDAGIREAIGFRECVPPSSIMIRTAVLRGLAAAGALAGAASDYRLVRNVARRQKMANLPKVLIRFQAPASAPVTDRLQLLSVIRVQLEHFAPRSRDSYLGLMESSATFVLPASAAQTGRKVVDGARRRLSAMTNRLLHHHPLREGGRWEKLRGEAVQSVMAELHLLVALVRKVRGGSAPAG